MSAVTDWLMVGITAVYAVLTYFILRENNKTTKTANKQLAEARRQFEQTDRPVIEAEFLLERRLLYVLRFTNHGRKTAQHVRIDLDQGFIDSLPERAFRDQLLKQQGRECIIGVDQHYDLHIGSSKLRTDPSIKPMTGTISYENDGRSYASDLYIDIENYMTFFSTNSDHDDLIKAIRDNTTALKEISDSINCLQDK